MAGAFTTFGTTARTNLVRLNANGTIDPSFDATLTTGQVSAIYEQADGKIIAAGIGNQVAGTNLNTLFRLNPNGSLDNSFNATAGQIDAVVQSFLVQPDGKLIISGSFSQVYGQSRPSIARITASGVLAVANQQLDARTQAWPVPAHETLNLSLDAAAKPESVELLDALGRVVLTRRATAPELALPVRQLKAGVYLLRVRYATGPVTRRVVIE
ncbi:T9SS type A sorting domain-containing protein [Hymenobacter cellulosilyticus]|uniref:T9SS type A sorting domain-containing protein n=1 Tax=Hymenobacter cellulosilyticus TaxID=2932248 RepID=A0A8T9QBY9_9BACT|nr:T9SS type A sorting domain-containing protein [Hymenobacter cellulosilyticus]